MRATLLSDHATTLRVSQILTTNPSVCRWFDYLTEQDLSVRRVFEAVDTDDSGYLDRDEMRVAITRLCQQEGHAQLPEEEIQKAMALMDRDGGGQTDYDE